MPTFIEVEYDPFAPVPVEHNPWEGQPDPFAYQPVASQNPRFQAYTDYLNQAPVDELKERVAEGGGHWLPAGTMRPPGYSEGEIMPPTEVQRRSMEELRYEHEALQDQGYRPREQDLSDALLRDRGRYIQIPEEYGQASMYEAPGQRISDFRYQPPLTQQEIDQYLQRPPVALNVEPPARTSGSDPYIELQGGVSPLGRMRERSPLQLQGVYRHNVPF